MLATIRDDHAPPTTIDIAALILAHPRGQALSHAVVQAVLDGDYERPRLLAEELSVCPAPSLRLVK